MPQEIIVSSSLKVGAPAMAETQVRYKTMAIPVRRRARTLSGMKPKLDRFIANPEQIVPGNNMKPFSGLAAASDRAKVITFLLSGTNGEGQKR